MPVSVSPVNQLPFSPTRGTSRSLKRSMSCAYTSGRGSAGIPAASVQHPAAHMRALVVVFMLPAKQPTSTKRTPFSTGTAASVPSN